MKFLTVSRFFFETKKRSDELYAWLKARKADVFLELDDCR